MINGKQLGCGTNKNGGTSACTNDERIWLDHANKQLVGLLCDPKDGLLCEREIKALKKDVVQEIQRRKREAANESGEAKLLRGRILEIDAKLERIADGIEMHGYTDVLDRRLKKLEHDKENLVSRLAQTQDGDLSKLPDIIPELMRRYRDEISALAEVKHGLSVTDLARARI